MVQFQNLWVFNPKFNFQIFLVVLLLLAAFFVRFWQISKVPPSLYIDEADYGLQARSLVKTFADYNGERSPFWVHSFNDIRTPIPAYLVAASTLIFKTPEVAVRAPVAILGTLVVFLAFLLVKLWTKSYLAAILTAAVFAFNPWQIQFSRFAHEGMVMMAFYLVGILTFFKALDSKSSKFLIASTVLLSLTVYTYRTMSFFIPLTFILLFLIYFKELLEFGFYKLLFVGVLAAIIVLPFLYSTTIGAPDVPRISQLLIFSEPEVPIQVQRAREVDSGDLVNPEIGKKALPSSFFFHNKILGWGELFKDNYLATFSPEFLFLAGDKNLRHSARTGNFYLFEALALVFAFIFVLKNLKRKEVWWLVVWLFTAPIPAALTVDGGGHAARLFILSAPLLILVGLGWWQFWQIAKNLKFAKISFTLGFLIWGLFVVFHLHRYFVHYPVDSARSFGFGFKQAILKISELEPNFQRVVMTPSKDPPMIYYFFWAKTNPKLIQEYGMEFGPEIIKNSPIDKYKVIDWPHNIGKDPELARYLAADTLYLASQNEIPEDLREDPKVIPDGVKLIDVIKYPDNTVAFYLLTRDPAYKEPKTAPKFKSVGTI